MTRIVSGKGLRFLVRPMLVGDLGAILAIERRAHFCPWCRANFSDCLKAGYLALVAESREHELLAYAIVSAGGGEADLLNVAVAPEHQRQGIARSLLEYVFTRIGPTADTLFLEVRTSNRNAIELYESLDFHQVGTRPNYYPARNGREDALIFARSLD